MQISSEAQGLGKDVCSILNPRSPILVIATVIAITIAAAPALRAARIEAGGYYLDDGRAPTRRRIWIDSRTDSEDRADQ
jgi:hypothetical protein